MRGPIPFDAHSEFHAFLGDGSVVRGTTVADWLLMAEGVVAVVAWFDTTYICQLDKGARQETRRYRNVIHSAEQYWLASRVPLFVENDKTGSLAPGVPQLPSIKAGALIPDEEWSGRWPRRFQPPHHPGLMNLLYNLHDPAALTFTDWRDWIASVSR